MNWRERWERLSGRERTLIGAAGVVLALLLVRFLIVSPFLAYRESLRDEIAAHRELLQSDHAYLARSTDVAHHLEMLRARYAEVRAQLVPGDTPTLAAASLQDTLHSLAAEKGINVQSTQVMREETLGEFRRIAVRITVSGELRQLAEFLFGVEFGPQRLSIPFLEISRRGAVLRGQSARALAATIEVNAFLQGSDKGDAKIEPAEATAPSDAGATPPQPSGPELAPSAAPPQVPPPAASGPNADRAVAERVVQDVAATPRANSEARSTADVEGVA
ncbi:MAG: type II secretion system protein M [Deltaproteobacteria bacterium]|nr:type II secretion system protein M [Deltaproteobacteria bacterium]